MHRHPLQGPFGAVVTGCHVMHHRLAVLILLEGVHMRCAQGAVLWDRGW